MVFLSRSSSGVVMTKFEGTDKVPFEDFIKGRLNEAVKKYDSVTDAAIDFDIAVSTFRRYLESGCARSSQHAKILLEKLSVDMEEFAVLLLQYYPTEAKIWIKALGLDQYNTKTKEVVQLIEEDEIYYFLDCLSGLGRGLSFAAIERSWGESGLEKVDKLIKCGQHDRAEGYLVRKNDRATFARPESTARNIGYLAKNYMFENIDNSTGSLVNLVRGLNVAGLKKMRDIILKAVNDFVIMAKDERYRGDTASHFSIVAGEIKFPKE